MTMQSTAASLAVRSEWRRNSALGPIIGVGALMAPGAVWLGAPEAAVAAALYCAVAIIVAARVQAFHPFATFGAANSVTLFRAALLSLVAPLVLLEASGERHFTLIFGLAVFILLLDALDGWLARRAGTASRFGARFDMEVDAGLIMLLASFAWLDGKAGAWVLMVGLMRYGFVAAGWLFPKLARALPESRRRKIICVIQIVALCALVLPVIAPPVSTLIAFVALALLTISFLIDVRSLLRQDRST